MNSEQQTYGCFNIVSSFLILFFVFMAGWLHYGDVTMALWLTVLWLAVGFMSMLTVFLPVVGPFIYWKVATTSVLPAVLSASGLTPSWLTTLILGLGVLSSIYWTIVGIIIVLGVVAMIFQATRETA